MVNEHAISQFDNISDKLLQDLDLSQPVLKNLPGVSYAYQYSISARYVE